MIFKIKDELPIKYKLSVHSSMPNYPSAQDFMFDVAAHIVRVTELKEKDWDSNDIKFSTKTLKYVFGDHMKNESFKAKLKILIKDLLDTGLLIKKGEFIFMPESEFLKYYLIA